MSTSLIYQLLLQQSYRTNKILIVHIFFNHFRSLFSEILISKNILNNYYYYYRSISQLSFGPYISMDFYFFFLSIDLYPFPLSMFYHFFLLLFFQTLIMSEQSEQLINQYIDEITLLPLPTSFESRRRTLDLCYAIRLEYTRTAASIARHKNELRLVVVLINTLKEHPPSQIEE